MTITHNPDSASVLYFSREELQDACLTPARLSDDDSLRLIQRALAKARQPIPPSFEISSFPSQHGVLFFVSPLPQGMQLAPASSRLPS